MRTDLSGGQRHPRSRLLADEGADRRRPARADHRARRSSRSPSGGRRRLWRYKEKLPHPFPRKKIQVIAGPPVDLSAYAGRAHDGGGAARGHRPDHGADHRSAGRAARRPAAGRSPTTRGWPRDPRGGARRRLVGYGVRPGARRCRHRHGAVGPASRDGRGDQRDAREPATTCPRITCRRALRATSDAAEALDGADLVVLAVPSQTLRANLGELVDLIPPDASAREPDEGRRARHRQADDRGDPRGGRRPERPGRRHLRPEPRPRDRRLREPAAAVVACTDLDVAAPGAAGLPRRAISGRTATTT